MEQTNIAVGLDIGTTDNAVLKFQNYKAFYQKIKQDSMLGNYKTVDLRFGNQVVATKK